MFNSILSLSKPDLMAKHLHFKVSADNLPFSYLYLDVGRCEQIVMNILGNAIKFTPEGGTIEFIMENVSVTEDIITDRVIIRDTGVGMSEEFLPHLFEPFSQERDDVTSALTGTGLGMTIVKQIIELMGGKIDVESQVGNGTTFSILIPMPKATEKQIKDWQESKAAVYNIEALEKKHVLLCEDHPLNTVIATKLLEKKGMVVEHAENGAECVKMFAESATDYYDIILMDIRMPVMDGYDATTAIRAMSRPDAATIPIVAMTANAFDQDIKRSREVGMDAHLSKPINTEKLFYTIEHMLSVQRFYKYRKILVVDDAEVNRAVIVNSLEDEYTILEAANGREAMKILESNNGIDMIITDIQMPEMDGIELIKKVRSIKKYKKIIIVANTQYGEPEQEEELLELGANEFIYKPSAHQVVKLRIKNALSANKAML